jgi:tetratricopeptide (TPR) repeat protein
MDASQLLDRANLLLEQGRINDCINHLKKALEADPENSSALALYGRCFFAKHQYDEGIETIQRAISLNPDNAYYFYLLGFGYYKKDIFFAAKDNLNKAIHLDPYAAEFFGLLSYVYLEEKDFNRALEKSNEGLQIEAENITCLNARSRALTKLNKKNEARETMKTALQNDPDNEFTHATVGWNLLERGVNKEAATHFREALRIDPDLGSAKTGLKEALKSKIPPYKWLLQYSFWLHNKGKNFRWAFVIFIYIGVRIVITLSQTNSEFKPIGILIAGCYFTFIAISWVINPVANLFLFFHPQGKYALDHREKWNAIGFLICILSGMAVISLSALVIHEKEQSGNFLLTGFAILSLCVPVGHMDFPLRLKENSVSQWFAISLIILACVLLILSITTITTSFILFFVLYCLSFIGYTWSR